MKMLRSNPDERITAEQALSHPYFKLRLDEDAEDSEE
jgi:serine/threonine protein kinase